MLDIAMEIAFSGARMFVHNKLVAAVTALVLGGYASIVMAAEPTTQSVSDRIETLQSEVDQLKAAQHSQSSTTQDSSTATTVSPIPALPFTAQYGYDNGFYIKDGDAFKIQANGLIDVRYSFEQATNKTGLKTTPLGTEHVGDLSGFNLFNGELSVQGTLYKNIFFKAMGNFGSLSAPSSPQAGTFEINELYAGYSFDSSFRIRAGSMIVPYVPLRGITNYGGLMFPDVSDAASPYIPGYMLGADVLGALANDTISYDLMIGNGSNSQTLTDSTLNADGRDNRLAFYTREQFVGAGKLSDFFDESDVENHQSLVWIVGGGFGYESQNSASSAFPGSQSSLAISGLSAAKGPGFAPKYVVNGNVDRYVLDIRAKYRGFAFFGEALYQHIQSEGGAIIPGYTRDNIGQIGYFVEGGYFVIPKHLELAGRFSQLVTDGLPHSMEEYEAGLNYYPFGQNLKLQLSETYVPRAAALSSNNGILTNTQDWLTQVQLQLKF